MRSGATARSPNFENGPHLSESTLLGLIAIFALGVTFDYINGFHDTANAIATSVSTRALKPEHAIFLSAGANFVGAVVFGVAVAGTIGSGIVQDSMILGDGATVLAAALLGAITWNLITWGLAIPSSSSHALIGGLIGAAVVSVGAARVKWEDLNAGLHVPLLSLPLIGLALGLAVMAALGIVAILLVTARFVDWPRFRAAVRLPLYIWPVAGLAVGSIALTLLAGAAVVVTGIDAVQWGNFAAKVLFPLISSPLLGLAIGFTIMILFLNAIGRLRLRRVTRLVRPAFPASLRPSENEAAVGATPERIFARFRRFQVFSAAYLALSHGSNDAQKTMGILTLALLNAGVIHDKAVPWGVILLAATAMFFGTMAGGWRIMKTMGQRVFRLDPVHGFAAELTAASVILGASHFGMPVSTTHVISSAIMGVGSSDRPKGVRWAVAGNLLTAWILTIPAAAAAAGLIYLLLQSLHGPVGWALQLFGV